MALFLCAIHFALLSVPAVAYRHTALGGAVKMMKFQEGVGTDACAFVVDGGSSGGRLYRFTQDDFCPSAIDVPLICGEADTGISAFAGTSADKKLAVRDVISVEAGINIHNHDWLDKYQGNATFVDCYINSLAGGVAANVASCKTSSLSIGATAGFREFLHVALAVDITNGNRVQTEAVTAAVTRFNERLQTRVSELSPETVCENLGGEGALEVLSILDEGALESGSTEAAAAVCDDPLVNRGQPKGVFSMGGMSSQFASWEKTKRGSKQKRRRLLLNHGHLIGMKLIEEDRAERNVNKTGQVLAVEDIAALRAKASIRMKADLDHALTLNPYGQNHPHQGWLPNGDYPEGTPRCKGTSKSKCWTDGLWLGIQGTAWAAQYLQILPADAQKHAPITVSKFRAAIEKALTTWENRDQDLAQLLILEFWLTNLFSPTTSFYFRKEWTTASGQCMMAEWPFEIAKKMQPQLSAAVAEASKPK